MKITHDKRILIAIGRSRKALQWQNKEMLWSEFLDKLAATTAPARPSTTTRP